MIRHELYQEMENYLGKWIYYKWASERDPHVLLHPDELKKRVEKFYIGLSECVGIDGEYLVLKTKDDVFRAKPWNNMEVFPPSELRWHDRVREVQRPEVHGIVDDIHWHYKEAEYKYFLIVKGKPKSRRYDSGDLRLLSTRIQFELATNNERAVASGYPKMYPVAKIDDQYYSPLVSYFIMLEYYYIGYKQGNNIDNWLGIIDHQFHAKDNEEYFGDQVCVLFEGDKVKLIDYVDYENGKRDFCEMPVVQLKKLTVDWKWFVIDWEVKMIKGEL